MSGTYRSMKWPQLQLVSVALILTTGCTAQPATVNETVQASRRVDPNYQPPQWMSTTKAEKDSFAQGIVACLKEQGVAAQTLQFGGVELESPTTEHQSATQECAEKIGYPQAPTPAEEYDRLTDIKECLIAQGFGIPAPPSQQEWIESLNGPESPWTPYSVFITEEPTQGQPSYSLTDGELAALQEICVPSQYGHIVQTTD